MNARFALSALAFLGLWRFSACAAQPAVPTPSAFDPSAVPEVAAAAAESGASAIPPPPAEDAAEPERIVHYFCRAWKDWDFKTMYGAMSAAYRENVPYRRFEALFRGDIETNGGLLDESIADEPASAGAAVRLKVVLRYRSARAAPRTVVAVAVREGAGGWRIAESGLLPVDLDDL